MWEMTQKCGKWLKYVGKDLNMSEIASMCGKRVKYVGNAICETA